MRKYVALILLILLFAKSTRYLNKLLIGNSLRILLTVNITFRQLFLTEDRTRWVHSSKHVFLKQYSFCIKHSVDHLSLISGFVHFLLIIQDCLILTWIMIYGKSRFYCDENRVASCKQFLWPSIDSICYTIVISSDIILYIQCTISF